MPSVNMKLLLNTLLLGAGANALNLPSLEVPACTSGKGTIQYSKTIPDLAEFPLTQVDLCYDDDSIELTFIAFGETNFYFNASQGTNEEIYNYEVMEAFIYQGTADPQHYLEFEVSPNNITFQAFIYNPSKVRAADAPFDRFYVADPFVDGLAAETTLDRDAQTWISTATIPLGLFNVDCGTAKGTQWRMNFFRTVVAPETYPDQLLGGWSPTNQSSFHMTPFFGNVAFV